MNTQTMSKSILIYDGDCPVCARYVRFVRLQKTLGPVTLMNARENHEEVKKLQSMGYDLNDGMLLIMDNQYYHGADCIHRLALMSTPSNIFNKINYIIFSSPVLSKILYPLLRTGRNFLLLLLGREKI